MALTSALPLKRETKRISRQKEKKENKNGGEFRGNIIQRDGELPGKINLKGR